MEYNEIGSFLSKACPPPQRLQGANQDCYVNWEDVKRVLLVPFQNIADNDTFTGATTALTQTAIETPASWTSLFTPALPEDTPYINGLGTGATIHAQEFAEVSPSISNLPDGLPVMATGGEYQDVTFTFFGLDAYNEAALRSWQNARLGVLFINKDGDVIGRDIDRTIAAPPAGFGQVGANTVFFISELSFVNTRVVNQSNNAEPDAVRLVLHFELNELGNWNKYDSNGIGLTFTP